MPFGAESRLGKAPQRVAARASGVGRLGRSPSPALGRSGNGGGIAKRGYYAVRVGRRPGIFRTWDECKDLVVKYPRAEFKRFASLNEAADFLRAPALAGSSLSEAQVQSFLLDADGSNGFESSQQPCPSHDAGRNSSLARIATETASPMQRDVCADPISPAFSAMMGEAPEAETIVVYTDGSCLGNGGRRAKAGIGVYFGPDDRRFAN
ncbi:hypothetical protein DFJ73DRAFT_852878 [Zopfochytrium polystomum]|nr:hypothetical protein DFJ73DRAFT_852878 [Zopfochytrium polystomum]